MTPAPRDSAIPWSRYRRQDSSISSRGLGRPITHRAAWRVSAASAAASAPAREIRA